MNPVKIRNLTAGYGTKTILNDISLDFSGGEIAGILGANGCGKTTFLKAICGILPHKGSCIVDGTRLEGLPAKKLGQLCGYFPQRSGISIDIPVLDAVLMGFNPKLGLLEYPTEDMKKKARLALERAGLTGLENNNYQTLSEGQKQLCMLARLMVSEGRLLLMDEPESALDFRHRGLLFDLLSEKIREENCAALITLHDPGLALNRCGRLILLDGGAVIAQLYPETDSDEKMADALSEIYGPVSIHRCRNRQGRERLVMLGEDE